MQRIASFSVDHTKLPKGMYLSRTDFDDINTYDIRMKVPNGGDYLSAPGAHTLEHLLATYARNAGVGGQVVYVGPMGCLTGMYLLTKGLPHADAIALVQGALGFVRDFAGTIPGSKEAECGNYTLHNLPEAQAVAADMLAVLDGWTPEDLAYPALLDGAAEAR